MVKLFRTTGYGRLWDVTGVRCLLVDDLTRMCRYGHWSQTVLVRGHLPVCSRNSQNGNIQLPNYLMVQYSPRKG